MAHSFLLPRHTAQSATLLVRAVDEILGTHRPGTGQPVLIEEEPPAALIFFARNATPSGPLAVHGRASSSDTEEAVRVLVDDHADAGSVAVACRPTADTV